MALNDWNSFFHKKNEKILELLEFPEWIGYKKLLKHVKKPKKVLELGCGTGLISLKIAKKYNAKITLVDYSKSALEIAKKAFNKAGIKAKFIKSDFFKLKIKDKFDLIHSQGVIEHFKNKEQKKLIRIHKKYLSKNGNVIILAPRPSLIYRIWRKTIEKIKGKWIFGYEKPLKLNEGIKLIESQGLKVKKHVNTIMEHGYLCTKKWK